MRWCDFDVTDKSCDLWAAPPEEFPTLQAGVEATKGKRAATKAGESKAASSEGKTYTAADESWRTRPPTREETKASELCLGIHLGEDETMTKGSASSSAADSRTKIPQNTPVKGKETGSATTQAKGKPTQAAVGETESSTKSADLGKESVN